MSDSESDSNIGKGGKRRELARDRTDYAEDRTVLANERTFASWFRTGFAAAAIGLGFNALFVQMNPWWVPRAIASIFFCLAILIFIAAERRSCAVLDRLSTHEVKPFKNRWMRAMMVIASAGILALLGAMWFLPISIGGTVGTR